MGTALMEPTYPLQDCKGKDSPGVGVLLLGGLFGLPARLEEGPAGFRSGRSAGDWRHTRDQGPGGLGQRRLANDAGEN